MNEDLIEESKRLRGLLWFAWHEFNTIRARSGAPDGVSHDYWDFCTNKFAEAIGHENTSPWMSEDARKIYNDHENGY